MAVHAINMGSGGTSPLTVNLCSRWRWFVSSMPTCFFPWAQHHWYFEIWWFCWCQNWFGCFGLETYLLLLKGYEALFLGYPDCSIPHWWNHPGWYWNFELGQNLNIGWYKVVEIFGRGCRNWIIFLPSECGEFWLQNTDLESLCEEVVVAYFCLAGLRNPCKTSGRCSES